MKKNKRVRLYMSQPPYSRDAEHKYIIKVINHTSSEIKEYHRNFIRGVHIDYQSCTKCLDQLLVDWEKDKALLETWQDYIDTVKHSTVDRKLQDSDDFKNLYFICDRTSHFEGSIPDRGRELMDCMYDHLYKYCISFEAETKGIAITSVQQYENDIGLYRQDIDPKFDAMADAIRQFDDMKSPFYDLIANGKQQESLIKDVCKTILDVCQIVKSWIKQDREYSGQIWQEMQTYQSNRQTLKENEKIILKKRDAICKKLDQIEKLKREAIHNYEVHKREKNKLKTRIDVVEDKIERLDKTLVRKRDAFDKTLEHRSLENPLTPRMQITYDNRLRNLRREVESLDGQVEPTQRHGEKLKRDFKEMNGRTYEYKVEAATYDNDLHDLRKELPGFEIELKSTNEGMLTNENKLVVMQKIRSHIVMADTLRKLHRDEELEKVQPDIDNFNEALQLVSENIGREWRHVYTRLPFIPPRDQWKKNRDMEILDMVAMQCDHTHEEQARKSFEKWLSFNRRGNIHQLIRTLRKARKVELASVLEEKYMVEDVY